MDTEYTGVEILRALRNARNYNGHLVALIREATDSREVVDFGAGVGTFAKLLRAEGFQVTVVEPDPYQRRELAKLGFEALASLDSLPEDSVPFLFSLNVFEHIEDDRNVLRQIYRKLKPGGQLLIYVPAFHCLWSSLDDTVCHFRRYTKRSLSRLVAAEGFSITRLQYVDCLGFIAALAFRLSRRESSALTSSSIRSYDRVIFPASRVLDRVFHPIFGKNVFVVGRKVSRSD